MKNKTKYKPGDVLKVPEKYIAGILELDNKNLAYDKLIEDFSVKFLQSKIDFWNFLLTIFPEIDDFECAYDRRYQTVVIKQITKDKLNIFQWTKFMKKYKKEFDI